jgi:hypothetical protein
MVKTFHLKPITMGSKCWLICFFTVLYSQVVAQQRPALKNLGEVKGKFIYMKPDLLGNLYTLDAVGQLKKYNASLDAVGVFAEVKRFGQLHSIIADNPLKTLIYFKAYKTILVLDRFLQVVNRLDLRRMNIFQTNAMAQSYDGKIWLYDEQEAKLKKLADNGKLELETVDLRIALGWHPSPEVIFELDQMVCLYDQSIGLMLFDQLGGYRNTIPLKGWQSVHAFGALVVGLVNGSLMAYDPKKFETKIMANLESWQWSTADQVRVSGQRMYVLDSEGIKIWGIPMSGN